MADGGELTDGQLARVDELIGYHSPLAHRLTTERTSYQSQMIPVTSYILVACCEAFLRYPDAMRTIAAAMDPEQVGAAGRRPGSRINTVHLWSIANFHLLGRKILSQFDPSLDRPSETLEVLEFWDAAARGFRGDGTRTADDTGGTIRVYDDAVVERLATAAQPVGDAERAEIRRHLASLVSYLFLLYFDTRVGSSDTGPYDLGALGLGPAGRTMIVRDLYQMGPSEFGWSDVAADVPYRHLVAGLVLDDVQARITDFGTVVTDPEDYLDRLVGISLFTTDGMAPGELRPVSLGELGDVAAVPAGTVAITCSVLESTTSRVPVPVEATHSPLM
ncbi:MAG: hypothetical protein KGR17_10810 [Acidobacteria bacterium]|nr:hypothetical protein [Acidobacteriota bacterium]